MAEQAVEDPPLQHKGLQYMKQDFFPPHWNVRQVSGVGRGYFQPTQVEHHAPEYPGVLYRWSARRHRKGRYPELVPHPGAEQRFQVHHHRPKSLLAPFGYKLFGWQPSSISYWVAMGFTVGSIVWVVNGVFAMWPLSNSKAQLYALGYTAFAGGFLFLVASYAGVLEALNADESVTFGHEVKHDVESLTAVVNHGATGPGTTASKPLTNMAAAASSNGNGGPYGDGKEKGKRRWRWWGWDWHSLSWWLTFLQLCGAIVFGVSACITGPPHVLPMDVMTHHHYILWDVLYWLPQCIGSIFFIVNSILAMWEAQHSWWRIRPLDLGWHVGFWNLLGGIGFFLSGAFGFKQYPNECCQHWGTAFSTFWGSIFFLMSSYLLFPEMLDK